MTKFTDWAWATLLLPMLGLYQTKADKSDVAEIRDSIARIETRVDAIHDYLLKDKSK